MENPFILSDLDRKILDTLQADGRLTNQEIANRIGSSPSSVWRRIRMMEEAGVIAGFRLVVNPERLGLSETVLLNVSLSRHSEENTQDFTEIVKNAPEVLECYATSGEHDYLLKVLATDMRAYYRFLENKLMNKPYINKTNSTVVMRKIKETSAVTSAILPSRTP